MIGVVSVDTMRLSDAATIAGGISSITLMRRAAFGILQAHDWPGRTLIVTGSGNNGGDGYALALYLKLTSHDVEILTVSDHFSNDSSYYRDVVLKLGVKENSYTSNTKQMDGFDTIVDCLLGTGFKGEVRGIYKDAINEINDAAAFVISADINSGMDGDTGLATLAVKSDVTVTIGLLKCGLITDAARLYMDKLVLVDIGIKAIQSEASVSKADYVIYQADMEPC